MFFTPAFSRCQNLTKFRFSFFFLQRQGVTVDSGSMSVCRSLSPSHGGLTLHLVKIFLGRTSPFTMRRWYGDAWKNGPRSEEPTACVRDVTQKNRPKLAENRYAFCPTVPLRLPNNLLPVLSVSSHQVFTPPQVIHRRHCTVDFFRFCRLKVFLRGRVQQVKAAVAPLLGYYANDCRRLFFVL